MVTAACGQPERSSYYPDATPTSACPVDTCKPGYGCMDDACAPAPHLLVEYYELLTSRDNGRVDNFARARTRAPTGVIAPNPAPIATAGSTLAAAWTQSTPCGFDATSRTQQDR